MLTPASRDAVAGAAAGAATCVLFQPLEVVKTRLQVVDGPRLGALRLLADVARSEGVRGLYAGLSPNLVGGTLSWGLYFSLYSLAKDVVGGETTPQRLAAAGAAGVAAAAATNPLWVAKTRLTLQRNVPGATGVAPYRGLADCLLRTGREEGMRGLYAGIGPSLALVSHNAIQMAAYEHLRGSEAFRTACGGGAGAPGDAPTAAAGAASKLLASCVTYPMQVYRTRLQQRGSGGGGGSGRRDALVAAARARGPSVLYAGFGPHLARMLPNSACTFVVFERVRGWLLPS